MIYTLRVPLRKLSLACYVLDAFTGEIVRSQDLQVFIPNCQTALHKSDGCHTFINLTEEKITVYIQEPRYIAERIALNLSELPAKDPILYVQLMPGQKYLFPANTAYLSGTAPNDSLIRLIYPEAYDTLFLQADYPQNSPHMTIYTSSSALVCGHSFCINGPEDITDFFSISKIIDRKDGLYELVRPLSHSYSCQTAHLFPVYIAKTNANGRYFLPLRLPAPEKTVCQLFCSGLTHSITVSLKAGDRKEINFTETTVKV